MKWPLESTSSGSLTDQQRTHLPHADTQREEHVWEGLRTEKFRKMDEHAAVANFAIHEQRRAAWALGEGGCWADPYTFIALEASHVCFFPHAPEQEPIPCTTLASTQALMCPRL